MSHFANRTSRCRGTLRKSYSSVEWLRATSLIVVWICAVTFVARAGAVDFPPGTLVDSFEPLGMGRFRKVDVDREGKRVDHSFGRLFKHSHAAENGDRKEAKPREMTAYKLKINHPQRPHLLEIKTPSQKSQSGSIRLVDTVSHERLNPIGPEMQFDYQAEFAPELNSGIHRLRHNDAVIVQQIFWPNDRECTVVACNRNADRPLDVSQVRVYELGEHLAARQSDSQNRRNLGIEGAPSRLVGWYLHIDELLGNFGGKPKADCRPNEVLEKAEIASERLVDYLEYSRRNSLMVALPGSVMAEISRRVSSENRGIAVEAPTLDEQILSILCRHFDRAGLSIIPELHFDGPLQLCESIEVGDVVELIDRGGRPWSEQPGTARPGKRYNCLSPTVQETILAVAAKFMEQISSHSSVAGLAFRLDGKSALQFPGIDAGYDVPAVRRFEHVSKLQAPELNSEHSKGAVEQFFAGTARREWIRHRTNEVAAFHRRLAIQMTQLQPSAQILFTLDCPLPDGLPSHESLVSAVRSGTDPVRRLHDQGLDFTLPTYASQPNVTVLRPMLQVSAADQESLAAATSLNLSPSLNQIFRGPTTGGFIQSVDENQPVLAFEERIHSNSDHGILHQGVKAPAKTDYSVTRFANSESSSFVQLLASLDAQIVFSGTGVIPVEPSTTTPNAAALIRNLPRVSFPAAGPQHQPLIVRSAQFGEATWIYVLNSSDMALSTELWLDCPEVVPAIELVELKMLSLEAAANGRSRVFLKLPPGGAFGLRVARPLVKVSAAKPVLDATALAALQDRIEQIQMNVRQAHRQSAAAKPNLGGAAAAQQAAFTHVDSDASDAVDATNQAELRQLTKTASSVKLAWDEQRYADCHRMLNGYWGRKLQSFTVETTAANSPTADGRSSRRSREKIRR